MTGQGKRRVGERDPLLDLGLCDPLDSGAGAYRGPLLRLFSRNSSMAYFGRIVFRERVPGSPHPHDHANVPLGRPPPRTIFWGNPFQFLS